MRKAIISKVVEIPDMTPEQCALSDRIGNLRLAASCLITADECLREEGLYIHGSLPEMIQVVQLAIRQIEEDVMEGA